MIVANIFCQLQLPKGKKDDAEDAQTDTNNYQWIPFMFLINAAVFVIPKMMWNALWDRGSKNQPDSIETFICKESASQHISRVIQGEKEEMWIGEKPKKDEKEKSPEYV